jgi:hypothetical protein
MGTPPRLVDPGEAFTARRDEALSGKSEDAVYLECSADPDADPDDREQWAKANPSFPHRTPLRSMLRLRKNLLSDESWGREALGIWDDVAANRWRVIPKSAWRSRLVAPVAPERPAFGIAASWPDGEFYSIGVAGRVDGCLVVQLVDHRLGSAWVPGRIRELQSRHRPLAVVMRDRGPTAELHAWMTRDGFDLVTPWVRESAAAFALFRKAAVEGEPESLGHFGQPELDDAVAAAERQPAGDGWVWLRKGETDISPVEAVTNAAWGHVSRSVVAANPGVWVI